MRILILLALLATLPPTSIAPAPLVRPDRMSHSQAMHLAGRPVTFVVSLASAPDTESKWTLYDVFGPDPSALYTVWLAEEPDGDEVRVEGVLVVIHHPVSRLHEAFTEYRIVARL